jgi:hypothetical protein
MPSITGCALLAEISNYYIDQTGIISYPAADSGSSIRMISVVSIYTVYRAASGCTIMIMQVMTVIGPVNIYITIPIAGSAVFKLIGSTTPCVESEVIARSQTLRVGIVWSGWRIHMHRSTECGGT